MDQVGLGYLDFKPFATFLPLRGEFQRIKIATSWFCVGGVPCIFWTNQALDCIQETDRLVGVLKSAREIWEIP